MINAATLPELPAPPIPDHADLRRFPEMPLDVERLLKSRLAATINAEEKWYAVVLWSVSWHQLPAGSLPDEDSHLCYLVGLGRDLRKWKKVRDGALHGWVKCRDGRLYHPVVSEKVLGVLKRSQAAREKIAKRWSPKTEQPVEIVENQEYCGNSNKRRYKYIKKELTSVSSKERPDATIDETLDESQNRQRERETDETDTQNPPVLEQNASVSGDSDPANSDDRAPRPDPGKPLETPENPPVLSKNRRGSRLLSGAILTPEYRQAAREASTGPPEPPPEWIEDQWARFVDYFIAAPGEKGVKLDWLATWRNWIRRSRDEFRAKQHHTIANNNKSKPIDRDDAKRGILTALGLG